MGKVFLRAGASVAGNELCDVAGLRRGWLRLARFFEPQEYEKQEYEKGEARVLSPQSVPSKALSPVYSERHRN